MAELADSDRLAALQESGLLTKEVQDRICHLAYTAAQLCAADVAQVNVLDENLQHHACQWPPPARDYTVPSKESGCRAVVLADEIIAIDDTVAHPITCDMPWVSDYQGYLGTPIRFQGEVIGALCVLSRQPRKWSWADRAAVDGVSRLLMLALEPPES